MLIIRKTSPVFEQSNSGLTKSKAKATAGSRGLTQKEQTETIQLFRDGGYNTMVATSIAEEGLDIGEVC